MELDEQFPNVERNQLLTRNVLLNWKKTISEMFGVFILFQVLSISLLPFQTLTIDLLDLCLL